MPLSLHLKSLALVGVLLINTGCGSSDSSGDPADGAYQFINTIADSPTLELDIDLDDDDFQTFSIFGFQQATSLNTVNRDLYTYELAYEDPISGDDTTLIAETEFEVTRNTIHTFVLSGTFANPVVTELETTLDVFDADEDEIEVRGINAGSDTAVVYLGDPSAGLNGDTLITTLSPGAASDPQLREDPEDSTYRLRITPENSSEPQFDSGEFDIAARTRRTVVISDRTGPDAATKSVFLVSDSGATTFANVIGNSAIQLHNAIADSAAVGVELINTATSESLTTANLMLGESTSFVAAEPGFLTVSLSTDGGATTTNTTISIDEDSYYTVVLGGSTLDNTLLSKANRAEYRPAATQGAIEFVNGLVETDDEDVTAVDLYALEVGDSLADAQPVFSNVEFLESANAYLPATTLDLVVTTAGSESILAGPLRYLVPDGEARLISVLEAAGGGAPNQIVIGDVELP